MVSPAGAAIRHWVRDAVEVGHEPSLPALTSLPAPGSLLVDSPRGPWVVRASGSKRLLGDYRQSGWSPHGLFVAVASPHQLAAVDPEGNVHWTLSRLGPVRDPVWSPDGFRIAYLDGEELRVVAGDGTGDRLLANRVAPVAPAWQPGGLRRLAFLDAAGRVEVVQADSGRSVFEVSPGPGTIGLGWSADGARLLVVRRSGLRVFDRRGRPLWRSQAPAGMRVRAGALAPDGKRVGGCPLHPLGSAERSAAARPAMARGGDSSPASALRRRRLLARWESGCSLAWRSADQWLFLSPAHPRRIVAISDISRQFDPGTTSPPPFPSVAGWCCALAAAGLRDLRSDRARIGCMKRTAAAAHRPHLGRPVPLGLRRLERLCLGTAAEVTVRPARGKGGRSLAPARQDPARRRRRLQGGDRGRPPSVWPLPPPRPAPRLDRGSTGQARCGLPAALGRARTVAQALNRLAVPVGDRCGGRRFVPEMVAASAGFAKVDLSELQARRPGVVYGPYIGVSCLRADSTGCDRVGFDLVLRRRAVAVAASVAGRSIHLISPGPVPHDARAAGRDWGGYLEDAGLSRKGSPFRIPEDGRARGVWAGQPSVYLPVRVVATYPAGCRVAFVFPRVLLSPGFG